MDYYHYIHNIVDNFTTIRQIFYRLLTLYSPHSIASAYELLLPIVLYWWSILTTCEYNIISEFWFSINGSGCNLQIATQNCVKEH